MNIKFVLYTVIAISAMACREKPVAPPPAAPAAVANTIQSGIYMGPGKGSCLCVNTEKSIAATSGTLSVMSINLGKEFDGASD